jgi:hypothetical protein
MVSSRFRSPKEQLIEKELDGIQYAGNSGQLPLMTKTIKSLIYPFKFFIC